MKNTRFLKEIKKEFEILRGEVGDYKPELFDKLEKKFYELYETKRIGFRQWSINDIKSGGKPVKEWLKAHWYPVDPIEKGVFKYIASLTENNRKTLADLMYRYLFKIENSKVFKEKCERLAEQGFNPVDIWLEKHRFEPVFREHR